MAERIFYRTPRGEWFYYLQTLIYLVIGLGLGIVLFFITFCSLLLLGIETDFAGMTSFWVGAGSWILLCFFLGDWVGKAQWVFLTCRDGRIFLLKADAMCPAAGMLVSIPHMGRRARQQIAWAEKLTWIPGTAEEILKVFSLRRTPWGFRARCLIRDGLREKKRTLRVSRRFRDSDLLLGAFQKLQASPAAGERSSDSEP